MDFALDAEIGSYLKNPGKVKTLDTHVNGLLKINCNQSVQKTIVGLALHPVRSIRTICPKN